MAMKDVSYALSSLYSSQTEEESKSLVLFFIHIFAYSFLFYASDSPESYGEPQSATRSNGGCAKKTTHLFPCTVLAGQSGGLML